MENQIANQKETEMYNGLMERLCSILDEGIRVANMGVSKGCFFGSSSIIS